MYMFLNIEQKKCSVLFFFFYSLLERAAVQKKKNVHEPFLISFENIFYFWYIFIYISNI